MKYVDSGSGKIPFISLIAILSISLTVNLPGLAISPIMSKLNEVFHDVSELQIQLLTVLPNLVTIPFILCSGKICTPRNQLFILGIGLGIYALTGVLYFFATSMIQLILLSCLLGVGCGLVIPLAASLISQNFVGKARTKELGMKSSLSNFSVIFATLFVGWMAEINWHLSFIVYMIPIIPLCLIPFMSEAYISKNTLPDPAAKAVAPKAETAAPASDKAAASSASGRPTDPNFHFTARTGLLILVGVMALYLIVTYGTEVVSYYIPFTMGHYGFNSGSVGIATAMFFTAATVGGFFLTRFISYLGQNTMQVALAFCVIGLFLMGSIHHFASYVLGIFIMGLGYGVVQPILYDKTSYLAPTSAKSTAYFSYLLTCNYIGISMVPFIIKGAEGLFGEAHDPNFSYIFNAIILLAVLGIALWKRKNFVFEVDRESYTAKQS